jgi:hypothetical protein
MRSPPFYLLLVALVPLATSAAPLAGCVGPFDEDDEPRDYPGECGPRPRPECPDTYWYCTSGGEWYYGGDGLCGACPTLAPSEGELCDDVGDKCVYALPTCGPEAEVTWRCADTGWKRAGDTCPPPCPDALPLAGSDCEGWSEAVCTFPVDAGCGETAATATCASGGGTSPLTWQVALASPCAACASSDPAICTASACRWLEPGCGEEAAVIPGCYPLEDCTAATCAPELQCATVSVDPCWSWLCDACHQPAAVCTPAIGGG